MKYIIYPLITVCSIIVGAVILTTCGREREAGDMRVRKTIRHGGKVSIGGNGHKSNGGGPAAKLERPIEVTDFRTLGMEVARLKGKGQLQQAVNTINKYKTEHSEDATKCRAMVDGIVREFVESPNAGSQDWRNVKSQAEMLGKGDNAAEIQQAITLLGNFWNTHPNERFAADHLINVYTARYLEVDGGMPNDPRQFE